MHVTRTSAAALLAFLGSFCACASPARTPPAAAEAHEPFQLVFTPADEAEAKALRPVLARGVATVEGWFGAPFPHAFTVELFPDRAALDASFPPEWGLAHTECWMVATGVGDGVRVLSPRAWRSEACEHDAGDAGHVERLLTHELVHVYHGQHNPSPDFVDTSGIDWFVEGLATLVSGQLGDDELADPREALEHGQAPDSLARAWSGRWRYGVCGSLVELVEHERGRARMSELLAASSDEELLALLGTDEAALLERWRARVLGR